MDNFLCQGIFFIILFKIMEACKMRIKSGIFSVRLRG
jgi:hypothetical protein